MKSVKWHSGWKSGKTGKVYNYDAQPGTIQPIDSEMVKVIKEPLIKIAKGAFGQAGRRYLYDRKSEIYGVVLSTYAERDIHDIFKNQTWQHGASSPKLKSGMTVFVVPNESVIKENPNAIGVKFKLA